MEQSHSACTQPCTAQRHLRHSETGCFAMRCKQHCCRHRFRSVPGTLRVCRRHAGMSCSWMRTACQDRAWSRKALCDPACTQAFCLLSRPLSNLHTPNCRKHTYRQLHTLTARPCHHSASDISLQCMTSKSPVLTILHSTHVLSEWKRPEQLRASKHVQPFTCMRERERPGPTSYYPCCGPRSMHSGMRAPACHTLSHQADRHFPALPHVAQELAGRMPWCRIL